MSERNTETVRRVLKAMSDEEFDSALALLHPDVELVPPGGQAPYRGATSIRRWMEPDAFRDQVIEVLETSPAAEGKVLAKHHITARGATSGIEIDVLSWTVWTFEEDGRPRRIEIYLEHEEDQARESAGLDG